MRKFLTKITIFIMIFFIILGTLNQAYRGTNGYKHLNNVDKFMTIPQNNIELVNLGNSHAECAFDYSNTRTLKCFNLALAGQTFDYDYEILDTYKQNLKKNAVVLVQLSYFSLYAGKDSDWYKTLPPRYYAFLDKQHLPDYSFENYVMFKLLPILSAKSNMKYIFKDIKQEEIDKETDADLSQKLSDLKDPEDIAKKRALYHKQAMGDIVCSYMMDNLQKILILTEKSGFKTVLVIPPYSSYYVENFSNEFFYKFYKDVNGIIEKNKGVAFLDYSKDSRFYKKYDLYKNVDHLNKAGALLFTDIVLNKVFGEEEKP